MGSRLTTPTPDEPILDYTGATIGLDIAFKDFDNTDLLDGTLAGLNEQSLTFAEPPALRVASLRALAAAPAIRPSVTFNVNRSRGVFSGVIRNLGTAGSLRSFSGVFLQHQNSGGGLVSSGRRTGSVTITPR